jgi:dTMP kinase
MLLLTFEGIDGSGKSTQARRLDEYLQEEGYETLLVREPGGTAFSERVRSLLLDPSLNVRAFPELLLFSAARAQLVDERIRPALAEGKIVICDRFYDSTTAYQGAGRGAAEPEWLQSFHRRVTDDLVPDRTYLVEVDLDTARARREAGGEGEDRMEASGVNFYTRVIKAYAELAEEHPERIHRLDGRQSIEALHESIRADVEALLDDESGTPVSGTGSSGPREK